MFAEIFYLNCDDLLREFFRLDKEKQQEASKPQIQNDFLREFQEKLRDEKFENLEILIWCFEKMQLICGYETSKHSKGCDLGLMIVIMRIIRSFEANIELESLKSIDKELIVRNLELLANSIDNLRISANIQSHSAAAAAAAQNYSYEFALNFYLLNVKFCGHKLELSLKIVDSLIHHHSESIFTKIAEISQNSPRSDFFPKQFNKEPLDCLFDLLRCGIEILSINSQIFDEFLSTFCLILMHCRLKDRIESNLYEQQVNCNIHLFQLNLKCFPETNDSNRNKHQSLLQKLVAIDNKNFKSLFLFRLSHFASAEAILSIESMPKIITNFLRTSRISVEVLTSYYGIFDEACQNSLAILEGGQEKSLEKETQSLLILASRCEKNLSTFKSVEKVLDQIDRMTILGLDCSPLALQRTLRERKVVRRKKEFLERKLAIYYTRVFAQITERDHWK